MLTVFIPLRFQPNHMKTSTNFIEPRTSKVPGVFQHSTVKTDLRGEQGICINQKKNLLAERLELDCVKTGLCQCSALLPTIPLLIFAISHWSRYLHTMYALSFRFLSPDSSMQALNRTRDYPIAPRRNMGASTLPLGRQGQPEFLYLRYKSYAENTAASWFKQRCQMTDLRCRMILH